MKVIMIDIMMMKIKLSCSRDNNVAGPIIKSFARHGLGGLFFLMVLLPFWGFAQGGGRVSGVVAAVADNINSNSIVARNGVSVIPARTLVISCNQTCMIVFPAAIQSADRGAGYVLAARVKGSDNVLKVKAGRIGFETSSLTVITRDGQVFAFKVSYGAKPPYLVLDLSGKVKAAGVDAGSMPRSRYQSGSGSESGSILEGGVKSEGEVGNLRGVAHTSEGSASATGLGAVKFPGVALNSAEMKRCMDQVGAGVPFINGVHRHQYGIDFVLEAVYFYKGVLFFRFKLQNKTGIPFKVASLRIFIRDVRKVKRTAVQDNELEVLDRKGRGAPESEEGQVVVVAVPRFTIADNKHLTVELMEMEGDRAIKLVVRERKLRQTRMLD